MLAVEQHEQQEQQPESLASIAIPSPTEKVEVISKEGRKTGSIPDTLKALPLALFVVRAQTGMSQLRLAKRLGTNREYISNVEQGRKLPKIGTLIRYAKALDTSAGRVMQVAECIMNVDSSKVFYEDRDRDRSGLSGSLRGRKRKQR